MGFPIWQNKQASKEYADSFFLLNRNGIIFEGLSFEHDVEAIYIYIYIYIYTVYINALCLGIYFLNWKLNGVKLTSQHTLQQ